MGGGRRVRLLALTSSENRRAALRAKGITPLLGNLDDRASLGRLAGVASRVLYLADQDADFWIPKMHSEWDGAIPATVIINPKNRKKGFYNEKFEDYSELESFVSKFF